MEKASHSWWMNDKSSSSLIYSESFVCYKFLLLCNLACQYRSIMSPPWFEDDNIVLLDFHLEVPLDIEEDHSKR